MMQYFRKQPKTYLTIRMYPVPRGGVYAALSVLSHDSQSGQLAITDDISQADVIIDDIIDSGRTKESYASFGVPFLALVDKQSSQTFDGWVQFPWESANDEKGPEHNIERMLQYIGEDVTREGLRETPARVVKSYDTLYGGYYVDPSSILKVFEDDACDEMVLLKDIEFYSTCEHHLLPFYGRAHIAYIPNQRVVGISKLARLLEVYSRRLQIQERIGQQITKLLDEQLAPKGSACILEAQHFCMTSRGVQKQNSVMITSSVTGFFREDARTRNELMNLIFQGGRRA